MMAACFASCQKPVLDEPVQVQDSFTASVEEFDAQTKTSMNERRQPLWSEGDRLAIFRGKSVADEYLLAEGYEGSTNGKFSWVSGSAEAGTEFTANVAYYPYAEGMVLSGDQGYEISNVVLPQTQLYAENSFANGAFPMVAVTVGTDDRVLKFRNVMGAMNLQFKGTQKIVAVMVKGNAGEVLSGAAVVSVSTSVPTIKMVSENAAAVILDCGEGVQLSETEATSFILALPPVQFTEGFTVTIQDADNLMYEYINNSTENEILRSGLLVMPELTLDVSVGYPSISDWGLVGTFQGWAAENSLEMVQNLDGWTVIKNVELYKDDEFKFVKNKSWDENYGATDQIFADNAEITVDSNGQNMKVSKNGKYDLYLNPDAKKVKAVCVEEYTDLNVDIKIDNKANWSPLYISLWDGDTQLVNNASVTGNKYSVSGDYIGKTLTYQLGNGSKTTDKLYVTITKTGAAVTLEETVVKLYFELNTSNEQQYWGNTTKIHVWNTGTSFDTSWPGTTMTKEATYKWSVIVPSELVGKTINFLVHNGNGWQSPDSKVTIKAGGVTVTSSGLGIK